MPLARLAGACYVVTIITGSLALVATGGARQMAMLTAAISYVVVTVLLFLLFTPVHRPIAMAALCVSMVGCAMSALPAAGLGRASVNPLAIFGVYCLLTAWLIAHSTLPRAVAVLMAIGGMGWLTFMWPPLSRTLAPWNFAPGIVAETVLTLSLLATSQRVARRPR